MMKYNNGVAMMPYEDVAFDQTLSLPRRKSKSKACSLEEISWYHGDIQRTAVEFLLLSEEILEGTYLLRKSRRHDGYAVSVKCRGSVKHFVLRFMPNLGVYVFGNATFESLKALLDHFESCPILTKENDVPVTLVNPLNVDLDDEPEDYEYPVKHGEAGSHTFDKQNMKCHSGSRSGYLYKRGRIRTNWKKRWFKVEKRFLKYYDNRQSEKLIRELDISTATNVSEVSIDEKKHSFQLVLPHRTFYFFASTPLEAKEWIDFLQFKIDFYNKLDG